MCIALRVYGHDYVSSLFTIYAVILCLYYWGALSISQSKYVVFEVFVNETGGSHVHEELTEFSTTKVFRWTKAATDVVIDGLRVGSVPKVILRTLRDHGCFIDGVEPTLTQLYNKVRYHIIF